MSTPLAARSVAPSTDDAARPAPQRRRIDQVTWDDGAPTPRPPSVRVRADAELLAAACELLASDSDHLPGALLATAANGLELTTGTPDGASWETALVPATRTPTPARCAVGLASLREVLQQVARPEAEIALGGSASVEGIEVATPAAAPAAPPRPRAGGLVPQRVELPASLLVDVPLRLPGVTVVIPTDLARRFSQRRVRLVSLFDLDGSWFLSGVAQHTYPATVLVGAVSAF